MAALNTPTPKVLVDAQYIGSSYATVYTCPASTTAIAKELILCNTDSSARTVSIRVVPSGATAGDEHCIFAAMSIAANTTYHLSEMTLILEAGDLISCDADTASKVVVRISGAEVTS